MTGPIERQAPLPDGNQRHLAMLSTPDWLLVGHDQFEQTATIEGCVVSVTTTVNVQVGPAANQYRITIVQTARGVSSGDTTVLTRWEQDFENAEQTARIHRLRVEEILTGVDFASLVRVMPS